LKTSALHSWGHTRPFNDYATYIKSRFGGRAQKISVNAGFTCPNRDGTKSRQGCTFCNNVSFRPNYCEPEKSVTAQLNEGMAFFGKKYTDIRYLAYFQSFSNTYAPVEVLEKVYEEALSHPRVAGMVIGTRPDCVDDVVLDYIGSLASDYYITIEYGIESTLDSTLERINRRHLFRDVQVAVKETNARGIHTGGHIILGLPGESREEMIGHAAAISTLGLNTLKIHHLQILRNTTMATEYRNRTQTFTLYNVDDYLELVIEFLQKLSPEIVVERFVNQTSPELLIAPRWGIKNFEFVARLEKRMDELETWQGRLFRS
jgi:radical SAM protein (TIGR01212 family)